MKNMLKRTAETVLAAMLAVAGYNVYVWCGWPPEAAIVLAVVVSVMAFRA